MICSKLLYFISSFIFFIFFDFILFLFFFNNEGNMWL